MIKAGIISATGYAEAEPVRLLSVHPQAELATISSVSFTGRALSEVYPAYLSRCDMTYTDQEEVIEKSDMIFTALSHGLSQELARQCHDKGRAFTGLSTDFRLEDGAKYTEWYGGSLLSKKLHSETVYSLPELSRENIKDKRLVTDPGCYITAVPLALAPAMRNGLAELPGITVDRKSGVMGAGRRPVQNIHCPEFNEGFSTYKVANHRHTSEMRQTLSRVAGEEIHLTSVPHLLPISRGILATCYAPLKPGVTQGQLHGAHEEAHADEPFLRLLPKGMSTDIKNVWHSNFYDASLFTDPRCRQLVVISIVDSTVKGAAGQAVQNMSLASGLKETAGPSMMSLVFQRGRAGKGKSNMSFEWVEGDVTAAKGLLAGGVYCGIRKNKTKGDLAVIYSKTPCSAAGVYTQNLMKGAPVAVTKKNPENGMAQTVICNSGDASTCNADGEEKVMEICRIAGEALGIPVENVTVTSMGVIRQILPVEPIISDVPELVKTLSPTGPDATIGAIMTTDLARKQIALRVIGAEVEFAIGGIAEDSDVIHPDMAIMLGFLTTDAQVVPEVFAKALSLAVSDTLNVMSANGDTSTNDMVSILVPGRAESTKIKVDGETSALSAQGLEKICTALARMIVRGGEGATEFLIYHVEGGKDEAAARAIAESVICSSLVKATMLDADANWRRVPCTIGYAGVLMDITKVDLDFESRAGTIAVCRSDAGIEFNEDVAKRVLVEDEININVMLHDGNAVATAYGYDLTYGYVKTNGDYRS